VGALQVPQYLLEAATEAGEAGQCNIICTQPRRIAAISVAERVANERGDSPPGTPGQQQLMYWPLFLMCLLLCSVLHCIASMTTECAQQNHSAEQTSPLSQPMVLHVFSNKKSQHLNLCLTISQGLAALL